MDITHQNAGGSQPDPTAAADDRPWQLLSGVSPDGRYPARTRCDGEGIIIFRTKYGFRGIQRSCPHMQASLMTAELTADDTMVRCSLHVYTFKLSNGKGVNCPGFQIKVYEVKEEAGSLYGRLTT